MANRPLHVLMIEDEEPLRRSLEKVLSRRNGCLFHVDCVSTLEQGLERLSSDQHDVVLLDLTLPDSYGLETVVKVARHPKHIPIVVLTGQDEKLAQDAILKGAQDFLVKGQVDPHILKRTIQYAVERKEWSKKVEANLRNVIYQNADGMVVTDSKGAVLFVNPAAEEIFDRPAEKFIGKDIGFPLMSATTTSIEIPHRTRGLVHVEMRIVPMEWEGNEAFLASLRDLTEHKKAQQSLKEAHEEIQETLRVKSEFVANTSHEIRTPLTTILGMTELLKETDLKSEQREYVGTLKRAGDGLQDLINNVLDLSKIESGRIDIVSKKFELEMLLHKVIDISSGLLRGKDLELTYKIQKGVPPFLLGDVGRLRQVLVNLVGNAIKFTKKGRVEIKVGADSADKLKRGLIFHVADTGIGIPQDAQARIFDSFTQVDSSMTRQFGGTGLGLTISQNLVELMGGRVWLESQVGKGTTVSFALPLKAAKGTSRIKKEPVPALSHSKASFRILVVEDSPDIRFLLQRYLKTTTHKVDLVENGKQAYEKFKRHRYDLVVMDMQMPVMDGYTALKKIREWERSQHRSSTPIVALTASALEGTEERCLEAGANAYLRKPIQKIDLLNAIAEYGNKISVTLDSEIADLVPPFLENMKGYLKEIRSNLKKKKWEAIAHVAHQFAGAGDGYGLSGITEMGRKMEWAAKESKGTEVRQLAKKLSIYINQLDLRYEE